MNMLFLVASPDLYLYFTNKTYPSSYFPLPSTSGCTPPNRCPQQQQHPQQCLPNSYYPLGGTAWQQPIPPAQYGRMPQAKGTYHQQMTMATPVYQPSQGMMMNVGQYPQGAGNMPMMQMGQQPMAAPI
jgi:hypothetical protein